MSLKKLLSIMAMLAISILMFSSCEDDPVDTVPVDNTPKAATELVAGAMDEETIRLQWKASASVNETWFDGYVLEVFDGSTMVGEPISISKNVNTYNYANCILSKEYTFNLYSVSLPVDENNTEKRSEKVSIKWATSNYFTGTANESTIRIYGKSSTRGSGLMLYDATDGKPRCRTVAGASEWDLGLYTDDNKVEFGSAAALSFTGHTFTNSASITDVVADANELSEAVFAYDLANYGWTYSSRKFNLKDDYSTNTKGIMFCVKTKDNHYARVIVKKINGTFLQNAGTADEYVEVLVSYQLDANKPYAKKPGK